MALASLAVRFRVKSGGFPEDGQILAMNRNETELALAHDAFLLGHFGLDTIMCL